jgi:hypothetical protein
VAENKTKATNASVEDYLAAIDDKARRKDCEALADLMAKAMKQPPGERPSRNSLVVHRSQCIAARTLFAGSD